MAKVSPKNVKLKRAFEAPAAADGTRILVDRLWPRGVKKAAAAIDLWAKDLAPSTELRKNVESLDELRQLAKRGPVTLIYAARDQEHNEAVIIRDMLVG